MSFVRSEECQSFYSATMGRSSRVSIWDSWAYQHRVQIDFSRPGKPTDNVFRHHSFQFVFFSHR